MKLVGDCYTNCYAIKDYQINSAYSSSNTYISTIDLDSGSVTGYGTGFSTLENGKIKVDTPFYTGI